VREAFVRTALTEIFPERLKAVPRIEKPFDPPALLRLVSALSCAKSDQAAR